MSKNYSIVNEKSEKMRVALLLAFVGGFLDSYSYLIRGGVFANAQTGNMVLMGINLINKEFVASVHYMTPIFSYFIGLIIAEMLRVRLVRHNLNWKQIIIVIEIITLITVAFLPRGSYDDLANVLISFVCALQVQAFRKVHGLAFASTMCTGNLIKAANSISSHYENKDSESLNSFFKYLLIIGVFISGAALGSVFCVQFGIYSVLLCIMFLVVIFRLINLN